MFLEVRNSAKNSIVCLYGTNNRSLWSVCSITSIKALSLGVTIKLHNLFRGRRYKLRHQRSVRACVIAAAAAFTAVTDSCSGRFNNHLSL